MKDPANDNDLISQNEPENVQELFEETSSDEVVFRLIFLILLAVGTLFAIRVLT